MRVAGIWSLGINQETVEVDGVIYCNLPRWRLKMHHYLKVIEEGCCLVLPGPREPVDRARFQHSIADRGCSLCDIYLRRRGHLGCLFAGDGKCSYCTSSGHQWRECPGRGMLRCSSCGMVGHSEVNCPWEEHPGCSSRVMVRQLQGEGGGDPWLGNEHYLHTIMYDLRPSRAALLGMMMSPDETARHWGCGIAVGRIKGAWEAKPTLSKLRRAESAAVAILRIARRSLDPEEREWAKDALAGSTRKLEEPSRAEVEGVVDPLPPYDLAHPHPWQEAIGRQSRLVGEALVNEAMYLCEGWRRPYPVLLYDLGETVAVHLEMEVCSALRRVLRGPRIGKEKRWEGIGFEDRKPREPWDETDSERDTSDEEWGADQDQEEKVVWSDSEEDGEETV